jgi:uncharacterized small protein (DUF1192 family)
MDWDDVQPKSLKAITVGEPLQTLSVSDLEERVAALEEEIRRVKAEIAAKQAHEKAAAAFFKPGSGS